MAETVRKFIVWAVTDEEKTWVSTHDTKEEAEEEADLLREMWTEDDLALGVEIGVSEEDIPSNLFFG